jgi:NADPH-dependent curcumin reductase CurA
MTQHTTVNREIRLASRPVGEPRLDAFALASVEVPVPGEGQVLVRNTWMSVDPYMRDRMNEGDTYIPAFQLGEALDGGAVGEVIASRSAEVPVGATVLHFLGWREYAVLDASAATVIDTSIAPPQAYLGVLGTPGLTAYTAVTEIAEVRPGDVVFVSAAGGAVGSIAGQIARKLGAARVIGSTGGPEKAKRLVAELGFDAAIDYRAGDLAGQLAKVAPDGIDVYVDNVGGEHLEAALAALRRDGRVAMVGAISGYNATGPVPGPANLVDAIAKQLTLRGVLVNYQLHRFPEYLSKAAGWLADGSLRAAETVVEGVERAPEAFLAMMRGANFGKMLVRLAATGADGG